MSLCSRAQEPQLLKPRHPWPSPCPRQGSRPLRFCGLQTPHPRGQSRQKPPLWGVRLGEGAGVSRFFPSGSRLLSGWAPGFKTSYICKNEDIPYVQRVPRPFPHLAKCFVATQPGRRKLCRSPISPGKGQADRRSLQWTSSAFPGAPPNPAPARLLPETSESERELLSRCGAWASHCDGFSCCGVQALELVGSVAVAPQALKHMDFSCT